MIILKQKTDLQNERGAALLLTMILMLVFSLLTVSLYELLEASTQITGNHRLELRTTYIADAGVEDAINELREDINWDSGFPDPGVEFPAGSGNTYTVSVDDVVITPNPAIAARKYIVSTGTIAGFQRRLEVYVDLIRIGDSGNYGVDIIAWKLMPLP